MSDQDAVDVYINADRKSTGGPNSAGSEYVVEVFDQDGAGNRSIALYKWNGSQYRVVARQSPQLRFTLLDQGIYIRVHNSKVANTKYFKFWAATFFPANADQPSIDLVPNGNGVFTYSFDRQAPQVAVFRGRSRCVKPCKPQQKIFLNWRFTNPESVFRQTYTIYASGKPVDVLRYGYQRHSANLNYFTNWPVPRNPKGFYRWCIRVTDWAGNRSRLGKTSCDKIRFPRIKHDAVFSWSSAGPGITVTRLGLRKLPEGTRVAFVCASGCGYREARRGGGTIESAAFRGKRLARGAVVVAAAIHPRWVGYYAKWAIGEDRASFVQRCIPPGTLRPTKRCA
jgi:hypothetical protein